MARFHAHTRYKNKDGVLIPGVTTVIGVLNKPYLVTWANKKGLEGIDTTKYVDEMASVGTCAHHMIECRLKNIEPVLSDFTANQIDLAEKCVHKFDEWRSRNDFEIIACEQELVSEEFQYGGTVDIIGKLNGEVTLIDIKTSKSIGYEYRVQVSAYYRVAIENGISIDKCGILRVGRKESEGFEYQEVGNITKHFEIFKHCRYLYDLLKEVKGE